jgi:hypothetical protein
MSITPAPAPAFFPPLQARNLNGRTLALPTEFAGTRNVVIMAFRRWHQTLVNGWFPALAPLLTAHPDLCAYELPMIAGGYSLARPFIDGGMARAIPNLGVRERTLTVYTNVAQSLAALQINSPETITILLVDRSGQIFWRSEGEYTYAKGAALEQALDLQSVAAPTVTLFL